MAFVQLQAPDPAVPGQSGYCLVYARTVFGIRSKYPTAASGWANSTYKHPDASPPTEVAVPVWFRWGTDGHVAVSVPGKGIYSTTKQGVKCFANIQALMDYIKGGITYLGWSEDVNGVRVVQPQLNPAPAPNQPHGLPAIGSRIQLIPTQTRTTWKVGTANQVGSIKVTDNTFDYVVRGYDVKFPGRIIINSASGGGDGVGLALYYLSGALIEGWRQL